MLCPVNDNFHFCQELQVIQNHFHLIFKDVRLIFLFGFWLGAMQQAEELWPKMRPKEYDSLVEVSRIPQIQKSKGKHMQQTVVQKKL